MTNDYYQKNKEKLRKEARERYQNLSEGEKDKKRQYARERYRNLSEAEKGKRVNMVVNDTKVFYKMSIEQIFLECKK